MHTGLLYETYKIWPVETTLVHGKIRDPSIPDYRVKKEGGKDPGSCRSGRAVQVEAVSGDSLGEKAEFTCVCHVSTGKAAN